MTEQAKVPEIRFAGFTDPWEQRKASEVFQIVDDRGHPTLPVLSATQNQGMIYRDDSGRYIGHDESNEIGYKRVLPGDFVVHLRSFQGGFAHSQYEGITSPAYTVFRAKEPTSHSDRFWKHWFMSEHFIAGLSTVTYGIRDGRSISVDEFMNTFLAFPAVEEQAAISRLLDYLDSLITLHQRKYDKLVVFKKSMLEKMFPKDGESVPEIRFAGFTDPWEQRKLGEFSKKNTIKNANGALSETFTNSAEQGVISQLDYFDHDITNDANISGYYVVQPDDFVYNPRISATAPCGPINRNRLNRAGVMSPLYTVFSVDASMDKTYLEHYFKTSRWHDFMFLEGNTGARSDRFSISDATFFEMPIWCPEISEQMAIAKQLETTDTLITLHQRKLELLQNIKKSLLDKMFA